MKKTTMQDRPDTWAVMLAWLVNHKNEAGYSVLAFVMSILATSRGAKSKWKDRIAGATMCGILCFFAQPTLTAIWAIFNWNFPLSFAGRSRLASGMWGWIRFSPMRAVALA
ncbi:phage holin family protein [Enterobacter hormaechei]|nr:phage holin family protein [Enterobacter hormaechei]